MEENEKLEIGVGNIESETLKSKEVLVVGTKIQEVIKDNKKIGEKVILICKHPDKDEPLEISKVKFLKNEKITTSGLWFNLDDENKILKNSALAKLLNFHNLMNIASFVGKNLPTDLDANKYLCIKAY